MLSFLTRVPDRLTSPPVITPLLAAILWFIVMLHSFNIEILQTHAVYSNVSGETAFYYNTYTVSLTYEPLLFFLFGLVMVFKTIWDMLEVFKGSAGRW